MPKDKPELQGMNFVLVGDFNPKIFHPFWFSHQSLISEHEGNEAKVEVVHSDVSIFNLEWMRLQVTRERFDISTSQEPYFEVLRDLVVGAFGTLEHTPVKMLGINHQMHFAMESEDEWHALGHKLAPKESWNKVLKSPGMQKIAIKGIRPDGLEGNITATVEPSSKIKNGVFFNINDHYDLNNTEGKSGVGEAINIIKERWTESIQRSRSIPLAILED